ncbi:hypothetical protein BBJ28_00004715 [Nothophytophthora sp. Chile5]|nr:hypothetical protein BBJ28_00004715 [Nothophytophthora sp. Chile5]
MLARVPPGDARVPKAASDGGEWPSSVRRRHSSAVPPSLQIKQSQADDLVVTSARSWSSSARPAQTDGELPILYSQYVARNVRVLVGSRWRLQRFQERTIVLRTGAEPELSLYAVNEAAALIEATEPEATYILSLDAVCQLSCSQSSNRREMRQSVGAFQARGIELSSAAKPPNTPAFRLRLRFVTAADAAIWCTVLKDTLAHARWSREVQPQKRRSGSTLGRDVYSLKHGRSGQRFVVKTLATASDTGDCHELQVLRRLHASASARDAGLIRGYRIVETPQAMLLVMPQFPGENLLQFLRKRRRCGQLTVEEVQTLVAQLAKLLQATHASGIVHCDLKLENVLVTSDLARVGLIDFGGAYDLLDSHNQSQFMTGTPGYIAPERMLDPLTPPTPQADVFSLGVLLFQALTGQHPFVKAAQEQRALVLRDSLHLVWTSAEPLLTARAVGAELRELVGGMLAADPRARISLDQVLASSWLCS